MPALAKGRRYSLRSEARVIFPEFDPVIINIGPLPLRWYALAYVAGDRAGLVVRRPRWPSASALWARASRR